VFLDHCLFFCHFCFGHCIVCPPIYGFWLSLCNYMCWWPYLKL